MKREGMAKQAEGKPSEKHRAENTLPPKEARCAEPVASIAR